MKPAPNSAMKDGSRLFNPAPRIVLAMVLLCLLALPLRAHAGPDRWTGLWLTPDQQGQRHFRRGEFVQAAEVFRDPMWQGAAWYRAGEFEKAAQSFSRRDTADAQFNQANAWLMRGRYETAIGWYDRALQQRPGWKEAADNRALAAARAKMMEQTGGDLGDQQIGADKIVFDRNASDEGQDTEVGGGKALTDQEIQALWLRRIRTSPADFLKAKFYYQLAQEPGETR